MTRRRDVTADELALWRQVMRDTTPLPRRETPVTTDGVSSTAPAPSGERCLSAPDAEPHLPKFTQDDVRKPGGLDAASQRRLRRGRIEVDARVDLHGLRQAEAHSVLSRFIAESQATGCRCVLVITGKGGRPAAGVSLQQEEEGVLRRQVPLWLQQPPNAGRIFAFEPAHPRHGGAGALYVFLRKARKGRAN